MNTRVIKLFFQADQGVFGANNITWLTNNNKTDWRLIAPSVEEFEMRARRLRCIKVVILGVVGAFTTIQVWLNISAIKMFT